MKTDSRAVSTSPSRALIPLQFVTSSNVNIPLELQRKLLKGTDERKALSISIKAQQDVEFRHERSTMISQTSKMKTKPALAKDSTCSFYGNKENNYVAIHTKQRQLKYKSRDSSVEVLRCINKLKNADESFDKKRGRPLLHTEMDSNEIERRYKKITETLDWMSKNIQNAIDNSTCP